MPVGTVQVPEESAPEGSFVNKFNNNELADQQQLQNSYSAADSFDDAASVSVGHSSFGDDSTHNNDHGGGGDGGGNEIQELARKETNHIRRWRWIVLAFILVAGAAVAAGSHGYLRNQESNDSSDSVSEATRE